MILDLMVAAGGGTLMWAYLAYRPQVRARIGLVGRWAARRARNARRTAAAVRRIPAPYQPRHVPEVRRARP